MTSLQILGSYITLTASGILLYELLQPRHKLPHKVMQSIFRRCNIHVKEGDQIYYPVLVRKEKTDSGWFLLYSPPIGMSANKFHQFLPEMMQALGEVEIEAQRGYIGVTVNQRPLKEKIVGAPGLLSRRGDV